MIYRRRPTPLHAARAGAAAGYCLALAVVALVLDNPLVLAADIAALLVAGTLAGCGRAMRRALLLAVPLAILIVLINALVTRDGLTVIARLGHLPVLGQIDVTLEATVYGGVLALRAVALILCGTLYTVAVDPDEMLQLFRRIVVPLSAHRDARHPARPGSAAGLPTTGRRAALPARDRRRPVCC